MDIATILTEISIALIGIDIAVYTISVSLLGSQLKRNFVFIQRRLSEAEAEIEQTRIASSSPRQRLKKVEDEVAKFKSEETVLKKRMFCLTVKGAVLFPCFFYALSIVLAITADMLFSELINWIIVPTTFLLLCGGYRTYCTLKSIDFAATNIPLPDFEASFAEGGQKLEIEPAKRQTISVDIGNTGFDVGELIEVSIFFPPDFTVKESKEYEVELQPADKSCSHPLHTNVSFDLGILHIDTFISFDIDLTSPKEAGVYKIPIYVNERKITQETFELEIIVRKPA
jgi:hypothetical protein